VGQACEALAKIMSKGERVFVECRLQTMFLTSHTDAKTHMRYVQETRTMAIIPRRRYRRSRELSPWCPNDGGLVTNALFSARPV
jgi:hypothetical protein